MKQACKKLISLWIFLFVPLLSIRAGDTLNLRADICLIHLQDSIFVHLTRDSIPPWGWVSSNGIVAVSKGKALIIDTPMDVEKTGALIDFVEHRLGAGVELLIAGHYHNDCMGGLPYFNQRGIPSLVGVQTMEKCMKLSLPLPTVSFSGDTVFKFHGMAVECHYPGGGHTIDNIVVYFRDSKLLFGGCLVKAMDSYSLGNLADAEIRLWPASIRNVQEKYPQARTIVPGHGAWGGPELLVHTLKLLAEQKAW